MDRHKGVTTATASPSRCQPVRLVHSWTNPSAELFWILDLYFIHIADCEELATSTSKKLVKPPISQSQSIPSIPEGLSESFRVSTKGVRVQTPDFQN